MERDARAYIDAGCHQKVLGNCGPCPMWPHRPYGYTAGSECREPHKGPSSPQTMGQQNEGWAEEDKFSPHPQELAVYEEMQTGEKSAGRYKAGQQVQ